MTTPHEETWRDLATRLEGQRWQSMLDGDVGMLASLLSADVVYVHSSGRSDDREGYLGKLRDGVFVYHAADSRLDQVTALGGDAFLASGTVRMEATVGGSRKQLQSIFLVVWRHEADAWRLVAHQTTLLPPA
jgi:ketosteroid isomerase-like protein